MRIALSVLDVTSRRLPFWPARNIDVIPGLAFYAEAAKVLGSQSDGNELIHAQMFLLAGLHKGQLARVRESMSWITTASRAIMHLLDRYCLYNDNYRTTYGNMQENYTPRQRPIGDTERSLIILASWTALQLESDILAELRLPTSGIQTIENMLPVPDCVLHQEIEKDYNFGLDRNHESYSTISLHYTAMLFIYRKRHEMQIYDRFATEQTVSSVVDTLIEHDSVLERWRADLPQQLRWNDTGSLPNNILSARLHAKYYEARCVASQPFLDYCLYILPGVSEGKTVKETATDVYSRTCNKAKIRLFEAISQMNEAKIRDAAHRCIDAAIHGTIAFDGIKGRLWVTNIHGTAHA